MRISQHLILVACTTLVIGCSKDNTANETEELSIDLDDTARASAKKLYEDYYLASASNSSDVAWTGDEPSCEAGSVPQATKDKILMRLDYYRQAVGLNNTIAESVTKSEKAQQAALMMHANGTLDHFPPDNWKCFTEDGKQAAGNSLLTSISNANAIDSYIRDQGAENGPVGHRRWLLWPRLQEMGIGNTNRYNALWVLGNAGTRPADAPEFITWPPEGFVPKQMAFPRWSFSIANADFTETTITMKDKNGASIAIETEELSGQYGDNTIVWKPAISTNTIVEDEIFLVSLQDVGIGGETQDFEYEVILFDPND